MNLREKVLANYAEISAEAVRKVDPDGAQMLDGKWYVPKWGCDTLAHTLDALLSTADSEQREWRGPWKCERCEVTWDTKPDNHEWFDVPCGPVVPYERRKGATR